MIQEGTAKIEYIYDANGNILHKQTSMDQAPIESTDYIGSIVFILDEPAYVLHSEGRLVFDEEGPDYQYFLKDHLGNTRVMFDQDGEVLQENSYYPFGMEMGGLSFSMESNQTENKYLYNGKELQDDFGLDWYDYGARFYDAQLGRWHVIDNKAEKYFGISQYTYGINNPLRFIDPDGNDIVDAAGEKITYDAKNGWSANATIDVKIIHSALMETPTGTEQWEKAYNSDSKINMTIVDEKLYNEDGKKSYGNTFQDLWLDLNESRYYKGDGIMTIKLSLPHLEESVETGGERWGYTLRQSLAATAGHEIEHTTDENRGLKVQLLNTPYFTTKKEKYDMVENKPNQVGDKIREESRGNKIQKILLHRAKLETEKERRILLLYNGQ